MDKASPQSRRAPAEVVLYAALTFLVASYLEERRTRDIFDRLPDILARVHPSAGNEKLIAAAREILETYSRRNAAGASLPYHGAMMLARRAVQDHAWSVFCDHHDQALTERPRRA